LPSLLQIGNHRGFVDHYCPIGPATARVRRVQRLHFDHTDPRLSVEPDLVSLPLTTAVRRIASAGPKAHVGRAAVRGPPNKGRRRRFRVVSKFYEPAS
jgi:hypothetical protein